MPSCMVHQDVLQFCFIKNISHFQKMELIVLQMIKKTKQHIIENMRPENGDVIIISSSDDPFVAEISAKNSALWTMATN